MNYYPISMIYNQTIWTNAVYYNAAESVKGTQNYIHTTYKIVKLIACIYIQIYIHEP